VNRSVPLVAVMALVGCGSPAAALPPDQNPKVVPMSSSSSQPATADALTVTAATLIPWSRLPSVHVVDVGPPVGGAFEVPGPRTRPVRPHLEIAMSPAGLAARVVQGDGFVASLAVRDDEVIALPDAPLAVAARSDGIWALYRDGLVDHDRRGAVRHKLPLSGIALIGGTGDAVWLVSSDQAWEVEAAGTVHGPFPWREPFTSFATGGKLCARDRRDARSLVCMSPDGARTNVALPVELAPLEHPVVLEGERMITRQGTTVRVRRGSELLAEWTLQVAGVDAARGGFVVTATATQVALWRPPVGTSPVVARRFVTSGPGTIASAAVDGDTITLYGLGSATTYRGSVPPAAPVAIDEATYRTTIFPSSWEMTPVNSIAVRGDGVIVLAASGPASAALIELRAVAR
jgi:hypothetical protein